MGSRITVRAESPANARRIVRTALRHQVNVHSDAIETAELLTSELVTNAIVYGSDVPTLFVDVSERNVHIEVVDFESTSSLAPLRVGPQSERGRGLAIVDALASVWGVEPRLLGKAVWFDLEL